VSWKGTTGDRARRAVLLAGPPLLRPEGAESWLVNLRWTAIIGMLATIMVAKMYVPGLRLAPLLTTLGLVLVSNIFWWTMVRRRSSSTRPFILAQTMSDMLTLALMLWFSGGLTNPFAVFLTFQIALAGMLSDGKNSARMAMLALALSCVLFFAPPLPLKTAVVDVDWLLRTGELAGLAGLGGFMGLSAYAYGARVSELRQESDRNEQLAMLGRLAGGMAHELNTPLATILLASNELVALGDNAQNQEVASLSMTLAQEARRASDLIELLRGRVRSDHRLERIEVRSVLKPMVESELARLHFAGAHSFSLRDGVHAWVLRPALQQIVANVLTNAVQALQAQEHARIDIACVDLEHRVDIMFSDNGPGIDPELLLRLGEPFLTTKANQGGTGLGLYVCSVLAKKMGAELRIESQQHERTRVTLRLPKPRSVGGQASQS
jgi:two-component system sensor histidine kinase RegB